MSRALSSQKNEPNSTKEIECAVPEKDRIKYLKSFMDLTLIIRLRMRARENTLVEVV